MRLLRRFVTVNIRPTKSKENRRKQSWEELLYSSPLHSQYNIPRILKGEPKVEALMKDVDVLDPNEEWYIVDMLRMLSVCATEAYFSPALVEDLHRFVTPRPLSWSGTPTRPSSTRRTCSTRCRSSWT